MNTRIYITKEVMETMGSGSLTGLLVHKLSNLGLDYSILSEVVLVFKQTSLEWRRNNGGPDQWIMPEFSIMCLLEGVMWLNKQGIRVTVEEETIDDE